MQTHLKGYLWVKLLFSDRVFQRGKLKFRNSVMAKYKLLKLVSLLNEELVKEIAKRGALYVWYCQKP